MKRRWRFYQTPSGRKPVSEFLDRLSADDAAAITSAMKDVAEIGLSGARHLRKDIYEVRTEGDRQAFRILFATEGKYGHVLLALESFSKKTQKTPPEKVTLAQRRLDDWRRRGDHR
ncbi:MAG: type II toxin-antitoxin system RelE/ParE family toxin [Actinomycetota bacterium]